MLCCCFQRITCCLQSDSKYSSCYAYLDDPAIKDYLRECARLAWKMVIQRPAMTFDVRGQGQKCSLNDLEIAWNSDPHTPGAVLRYYQYPTLRHGGKVMVKGTVFMN